MSKSSEEPAPQVVFLDIAMPDKDGLAVSREICVSCPEIVLVFATAYEEFTREAFVIMTKARAREMKKGSG